MVKNLLDYVENSTTSASVKVLAQIFIHFGRQLLVIRKSQKRYFIFIGFIGPKFREYITLEVPLNFFEKFYKIGMIDY
jgi:hypothetical protein